ncbi:MULTISPECIES: ATP-binding protein [Streptomyces]|uniref:ATP-binding protein n=1 Tax=Streptomyces solicathayae TaxID=3081768 RepID=A0ABZ0M3E7_9ACTN|nr:ATP-binding protein [Streptomyces sp. HUAS YS2]WOX26030.1 ATP-binding protein [Streptomyces sp. HUAS YS2]
METSRRIPLTDGAPTVGECRDRTAAVLHEWFGRDGGTERAAVDDVLLLVSELVTNAYTHGGAPYELLLDRVGDRLWVQVSDTSPVRPRPHGPHKAGRPSGHGLYLLERLADAWGWVPRGAGKAVWFEITVLGGVGPHDGEADG